MIKNIFNKIKGIRRETLIRNSFLLPILLVVIISISHVISWYDIGNPIAWAIYLSVAVEVFALASISAASIHASKKSIWLLFGLVTAIQMIGNIFFEFNDIDVNSNLFKSWVDLIRPLFEDWDAMDHRRFLAIIQGGSLPIMSLTALHYYIKFNERFSTADVEPKSESAADVEPKSESAAVEEELSNETNEVEEQAHEAEVATEEVKEEVPAEPIDKKEISPADQVWIELNGNKDDEDDIAKYNPQE